MAFDESGAWVLREPMACVVGGQYGQEPVLIPPHGWEKTQAPQQEAPPTIDPLEIKAAAAAQYVRAVGSADGFEKGWTGGDLKPLFEQQTAVRAAAAVEAAKPKAREDMTQDEKNAAWVARKKAAGILD